MAITTLHRVYRVFRNKYALQTAITDSQLLRMVMRILLVALVPYCVWMISDPPTLYFEHLNNPAVLETCQSNILVPAINTSPFILAIFVYFIILELWAIYLAYMVSIGYHNYGGLDVSALRSREEKSLF